MADARADEADGPALVLGGLYGRAQPVRLLYRLICESEDRSQVVFKVVGEHWLRDPTPCQVLGVNVARTWLLEHGLELEDETIIPKFMKESDKALLKEPLGKDWLRERAEKLAKFEDLRAGEPLFSLYSPARGAGLVRQYLERHVIDDVKRDSTRRELYRLMHRFAWFGCSSNAFLPLDKLKGTTGRRYAADADVKRGRPNAAEVLHRAGHEEFVGLEGVNITRADERRFIEGLNLFYVKADRSLRRTYDLIVEKLYKQATRVGEGDVRCYPIHERHIPTFKAFEKWFEKFRKTSSVDILKAGHKDGKEMDWNRGRSTDIAPNVADVYDTDASPGKVELVTTFKVDGEHRNIGTAMNVLVFDRRSTLCVGWAVYIGSENWEAGYRIALFCAFTDKQKELDRLGIDVDARDVWPDSPLPSYVYFDGGPAASKRGFEAYKRLNVGAVTAPPDTPYWKPLVEGVGGHFHEVLSESPGGYRRTNRAKDKDAKREAKKYASKDIVWYERKLVEQLIEYNLRVKPNIRMTSEMRMDGVERTPSAVFRWGFLQNSGLAKRVLPEAEIYWKMLETKGSLTISEGHVRLNRRRYTSAELQMYARKNPGEKIEVAYHRQHARTIVWIAPDGSYQELHADRGSIEEFGDFGHDELLQMELLQAATEIKNAAKKPKKGTFVTKRQRNIAMKGMSAGHKKQRNVSTADVKMVRSTQAAIDAALHPRDQLEHHVPMASGSLNPEGFESPVSELPPQKLLPGEKSIAQKWMDDDDFWDER